jgi:hypothetical protein
MGDVAVNFLHGFHKTSPGVSNPVCLSNEAEVKGKLEYASGLAKTL